MYINTTDKYMDFNGRVYFYDDVSKLPRTKENAFLYTMAIICRSWTWALMTDTERETMFDLLQHTKAIGNINQRMETYFTVQHAYLRGIGYNGGSWRGAC